MASGLSNVAVDDYSTEEYLRALAECTAIKVLYQSVNCGKGAALRADIHQATGDLILIQNADLEYDLAEYPKLLEPILAGKADVVYGSRFAGSETHRVFTFWHVLGNRLLTLFSNMFTNLNLTDVAACYKLFKREILDQINLQEDRFAFDPEVTAKVARLRYAIYGVGISYYGRSYQEGKKINWRNGIRATYVIVKYGLLQSRTVRKCFAGNSVVAQRLDVSLPTQEQGILG